MAGGERQPWSSMVHPPVRPPGREGGDCWWSRWFGFGYTVIGFGYTTFQTSVEEKSICFAFRVGEMLFLTSWIRAHQLHPVGSDVLHPTWWPSTGLPRTVLALFLPLDLPSLDLAKHGHGHAAPCFPLPLCTPSLLTRPALESFRLVIYNW